MKKIVLILEGEKKFEGSIKEFTNLFQKEKTIVFYFKTPVTNFSQELEKSFHCKWSPDSTQLKIRVPEAGLKEVVFQVFNQFPVSDFHTEKTGVEEVMDKILSK